MALCSGVLLAIFLFPLSALFTATASASATTATNSASTCTAPHLGNPPLLGMSGP